MIKKPLKSGYNTIDAVYIPPAGPGSPRVPIEP